MTHETPDTLILRALDIVSSQGDAAEAARRLAGEVHPRALRAARDRLVIGLGRNPIVDLDGIRAARLLLAATRVPQARAS